jgi:hypothetical protein
MYVVAVELIKSEQVKANGGKLLAGRYNKTRQPILLLVFVYRNSLRQGVV